MQTSINITNNKQKEKRSRNSLPKVVAMDSASPLRMNFNNHTATDIFAMSKNFAVNKSKHLLFGFGFDFGSDF